MKRLLSLLTLLTVHLSLLAPLSSAQELDLSGTWDFVMGDAPNYDDVVTLPGSMLTNGRGRDVSVDTQWTGSLYDSSYYFRQDMAAYRVPCAVRFPFFLTPSKEYVGMAWYGRTVDVPATWAGRRVFVHIERAHIETTVRVNGRVAGRDSSLSVPHVVEVTDLIRPGQTNRIDIGVNNRIDGVGVGQDSHSVTDQTQGNWNGLIGQLKLVARPQNYIDGLQVHPRLADRSIDVVLQLRGAGPTETVTMAIDDGDYTEQTVEVDSAGVARLRMPIEGDLRTWSEWEPNLYALTATWGKDTLRTTFGMREISTRGRQILVNDTPVWMRGTVENCCFPLTGYPPTDVESWTYVFKRCKTYGLNHVRFHSYCPPEAAFTAADSVGIYLQVEGPTWPNHGVKLGVGMTIDRYLMDETRRIIACYGNHPSFVMLASGNEPAGNWVDWTNDFVDFWSEADGDRRLFTSASVGGGWAFTTHSQYHVRGGARGLTWNRERPHTLDDYSEPITNHVQRGRTTTQTFPVNEPFLSHEAGQWCAFPDLGERSQYTGAYKAGNFDIFADLLESGGMADRATDFLMASGRLQTLAYKFDIERNLRTADYAGFQLLSLNDYSGQGTALVGVLNVFWREKGYCTADDWTEFCSPVVPLARFPRFVYTTADTLCVPVELYNAYRSALTDAQTTYTITIDDGTIIATATTATGDIALGKGTPLCTVTHPLHAISGPTKLTLTVSVDSPTLTDTRARNHWDFWVYPATVDMPTADIYITDTLDAEAQARLAAGERVLITAAGRVRMGSDVKQTYLPVFWNTSWFKMRPPHTTGVSIDTTHPLFTHFPTDDWATLNYWELVNNAQVMYLGGMPTDYQSPIQPIDTWHLSRKLGMLIEANVGGGRLLMTTMDITTDLDTRVVARQMRAAILSYMASDDFRPTLSLDAAQVTELFERDAPRVDMYTNDSPDELKPTIK